MSGKHDGAAQAEQTASAATVAVEAAPESHDVRAASGPRAVIEQRVPSEDAGHPEAVSAAGSGPSPSEGARATGARRPKKRRGFLFHRREAGGTGVGGSVPAGPKTRLDVDASPEGDAIAASGAGAFEGAAMGFVDGVSRRAWAYADAHPHTVLYGFLGFLLAVLILVIGLWHTVVIAIFVGVGALIGRMRDGDGEVRDVVERFFSERR